MSSWLSQALTNQRRWGDYLAPFRPWWQPQKSANLHGTRVVSVRAESDRVHTYVLQPDRRWPGFVAGQHVAVQVELNGRLYWRTFSLSQAPSHWQQTGLIELTIQTQPQGTVTPQLPTLLTAGSRLRITPAHGRFTAPKTTAKALMIAGGSGITPIRSMLQQWVHQNPTHDITLLYYNAGREPLFKAEWSALEQSMPHFRAVMIDTETSGLIQPQQLLSHCPDLSQREVFMCGPAGMMQAAHEQLLGLGLDPAQLHQESFGQAAVIPANAGHDGEPVSVHFSQSNKSINSTGSHTLLQLAEQADTLPNSGCRAGICHQCKCRKTKGLVYNTLTQQHSDTGPEDIQLCVSIPLGPVSLEL